MAARRLDRAWYRSDTSVCARCARIGLGAFASKTDSARRKNAAPAQRQWNAPRDHSGLRGPSLACAAFFPPSQRRAPTVFCANASSRRRAHDCGCRSGADFCARRSLREAGRWTEGDSASPSVCVIHGAVSARVVAYAYPGRPEKLLGDASNHRVRPESNFPARTERGARAIPQSCSPAAVSREHSSVADSSQARAGRSAR